jgi:hypothetical protein
MPSRVSAERTLSGAPFSSVPMVAKRKPFELGMEQRKPFGERHFGCDADKRGEPRRERDLYLR